MDDDTHCHCPYGEYDYDNYECYDYCSDGFYFSYYDQGCYSCTYYSYMCRECDTDGYCLECNAPYRQQGFNFVYQGFDP